MNKNKNKRRGRIKKEESNHFERGATKKLIKRTQMQQMNKLCRN